MESGGRLRQSGIGAWSPSEGRPEDSQPASAGFSIVAPRLKTFLSARGGGEGHIVYQPHFAENRRDQSDRILDHVQLPQRFSVGNDGVIELSQWLGVNFAREFGGQFPRI